MTGWRFIRAAATRPDLSAEKTLRSLKKRSRFQAPPRFALQTEFSFARIFRSYCFYVERFIVQKGWALDGRPTPGSQKFEFDLAQREMGLKEPPKAEQVYDFSILDEANKK